MEQILITHHTGYWILDTEHQMLMSHYLNTESLLAYRIPNANVALPVSRSHDLLSITDTLLLAGNRLGLDLLLETSSYFLLLVTETLLLAGNRLGPEGLTVTTRYRNTALGGQPAWPRGFDRFERCAWGEDAWDVRRHRHAAQGRAVDRAHRAGYFAQ